MYKAALQKVLMNKEKDVFDPLKDKRELIPAAQLKSLKIPPSFDKPIKLNLLAIKTDQRALCEICDRYGTLLCSVCRATYYCEMEHLKLDKELHTDLCPLISILRAPPQFYSCPDTRERMKKQHFLRLEEMYTYTYLNGKLAMLEGKYDRAIAALCASCRTAKDAFGISHHMIPPKVVLSECYLRMGDKKKAQRYLADCLRLEITLDDVSRIEKATIRHVEGLISVTMGEFQFAKHSFAEQIYFYTEEYNNPVHIRTASGYFYLGKIFFDLGEFLTAKTLMRKVLDIWGGYFDQKLEAFLEKTRRAFQIMQGNVSAITSPSEVGFANSRWGTAGSRLNIQKLQESSDKQEGMNNLRSCYNVMCEMDDEFTSTIDFLEIDYARAGFLYLNDRIEEAELAIAKALSKFQLYGLKDDPIYQKFLRFYKTCQKRNALLKKV